MGSLVLARAELEAFAGRGELDDDAIVDLAEARWRTGDLAGAGEVASAAIAAGHEDPLALIIAAEAIAALGRPGEARRLAGRALDAVHGSLDPLFAGMPRSLIWPIDPEPVAGTAAAPALPPIADDHLTPLPDADEALDAGRAALERGDRSEGVHRLAIALRLGPVLAPAVLDALGSTSGPEAELLRGDAFRLVGREIEARRSYAIVLGALAAPSGPGPDGGPAENGLDEARETPETPA
jgi:hypothetical protein